MRIAHKHTPTEWKEQKIVKLPVFHGKLYLTKPLHSLSEYFSEFVLNNFEILHFSEHREDPNKFPVPEKLPTTPDFLVMKLRKK